jgi:hypothetical protein
MRRAIIGSFASLRVRFGDLPSATVARVRKAGAPELSAWACRVMTAASLDEVLEVKGRHSA